MKSMKTLVIHPEDSTTAFLKQIYEQVHNKTVINGGISKETLKHLIVSHDRIMMMGHGSPGGLLSAGCFPGAGMYIIDNMTIPLLRKMSNNVYIWCNADWFVNQYDLEGFYSGMFVSEVGEASSMGLSGVEQSDIEQSNISFSKIMARHINESSVTGPQLLCENVKHDYGLIIDENPVARYNHERLYYKHSYKKQNN